MSAKTYTINTTKAVGEVLDGEAIIINLETGSYYSMNPSGSSIWEALSANSSIDTSLPETKHFLSFLVSEGIIAEATPSEGSTHEETTNNTPIFVPQEKPTIEKYTDMQEMLLADPIHDVDTAGWPNMPNLNA
jgi:hypothetical protein